MGVYVGDGWGWGWKMVMWEVVMIMWVDGYVGDDYVGPWVVGCVGDDLCGSGWRGMWEMVYNPLTCGTGIGRR